MTIAKLIYDVPRKNADLMYAAEFDAPDAILFLEKNGKRYLVLSDLEVDRGKIQAKVDEVLSLTDLTKKANDRHGKTSIAYVIDALCRSLRVKKLCCHPDTSFEIVDVLRDLDYEVMPGSRPFYQDRLVKTIRERNYIRESQHMVFRAIGLVRNILRDSIVRRKRLVYQDSPLTSERVHQMINVFLAENGFDNEDAIVAGGAHSVDPHNVGSGALRANESIIIDIFPCSKKTGYYGDATRTFCKGRASDKLHHMYQTVKTAQLKALKTIRNGTRSTDIHQTILDDFTEAGYSTTVKNGRNVGFFHSTGHGLGLDIHEPPRIALNDSVLKKHMVVSVEPGLYYPDIGGVRIEDLVIVEEKNAQVLGSAGMYWEKDLVIE